MPLKRLIEEFLEPALGGAITEDFHHLLAGVSRLVNVTSELAGEIDSDRILQTITSEACKAMHCERASIFQYDPEKVELYSTVVTELEIGEIRHSLDEGITGYVARTRELLNVSDPASDPRWSSHADQATGFTTRNILTAPLVAPHDNSLLGVLQLLNREEGSFDKVDEELLRAFSQHAAVALERSRLIDELKHRQSMQVSLNVAREIQRNFMPSKLPEIPRYEVATWWRSTEETGGDYCDIIQLKDGRMALVIADVSGHGLGPSLIMASVRAALHALVLEHDAPEVLLNLLSRSLKKDLTDGRFITMVIAALDSHENSLEYSNAGHGPALHYQASTGEFSSLESTGMPLGVLLRTEYPQGWPIDMERDDLLFLSTDGITEAMDAQDHPFGLERLQKLIRSMAAKPINELVEKVGVEVESHLGGRKADDDLTVLALRRNR
jgi:serine phosphatase RsbU (regulator of sigma subunit)